MNLMLAILAVLVCTLDSALASVQVTKLNPPVSVNSFYQFEDPDASDPLCIDFDNDGQVDFRIAYFYGGIDAYFSSPTRIVIAQQFYPWITNVTGSLGALPLGTVIGSNLVSSVDTNVYIWDGGATNHFDEETQGFGDHKSIGVYVLDPATIGLPLVVGGDPSDKEGVLAIEFMVGTNKHYGYIHFDFRSEAGWYKGCGGYILGWAYETEPNKPIVAAPVAVPPTPFRLGVQAQGGGTFDLNWRATPGATYRVQGATNAAGPFTDFTPDIVPPSADSAAPLVELATFHGMEDFPAFFWRVVRTH